MQESCGRDVVHSVLFRKGAREPRLGNQTRSPPVFLQRSQRCRCGLSSAIEDYALIGDCHTAALVSREGSIDWLCWPAFDSDACFAALLGNARHGRWKIAPADDNAHVTRRYQPGTLILETTFETDDGAVALVDFMPPRGVASDVVRIVRGIRGTVRVSLELIVRFGSGSNIPWVRKLRDGTWHAISGPDMVVLRTSVA